MILYPFFFKNRRATSSPFFPSSFSCIPLIHQMRDRNVPPIEASISLGSSSRNPCLLAGRRIPNSAIDVPGSGSLSPRHPISPSPYRLIRGIPSLLERFSDGVRRRQRPQSLFGVPLFHTLYVWRNCTEGISHATQASCDPG